MMCRFVNAGKSEKVVGWNRYRCNMCGDVHHSPYGVEKQIGNDCKSWPRLSDLGEWASDSLAAHGITPELVSWAIGRKCNCEARAAWLNSLGGQLAHSTSRLGKFLARLLVKRLPSSHAGR